ncbi:MAG: hypothetical protein AB7F86_06575 [Bdellovibrionales bacterium]
MKSAWAIILSGYVWAGSAVAWQPATDCRANIKVATCRVNPFVNDKEEDHDQRPCLGGEEKYVQQIENAYDLMPKKVQQVFCGLRRIYIEESFYATGYASYISELKTDSSGREVWQANGLVIGLNKARVFENGWTLSEWYTRKEMTLFGLQMTDPIPPGFPNFQVSIQFLTSRLGNPLLYSTLVHEVGHLVDMMLDIVKRDPTGCLNSQGSFKSGCKPDYSGIWTSLSWSPQGKVLPEYQTPHLEAPCYYNCTKQNRPLASAKDFYFEIADKGQFVSPYAAVNPREDFADTFHNFFLEDGRYRQNDLYYLMVSDPGQGESISFRLRGKGLYKFEFLGYIAETPWPNNMPANYNWPAGAQLPEIPRRVID